MEKLRRFINPYLLGFITIYVLNFSLATYYNTFNTSEVIGVIVIIGILFSGIAWLISRRAKELIRPKSFESGEIYVLLSLVIYISMVLIPGNKILFVSTESGTVSHEVITIIRKVFTFVVLPFLVYRFAYRFKWEDFGLSLRFKEVFTKKNVLILLVMGTVVLLLNYFAGNGAKPIREGPYSASQLIIGLPLLFVWLFIEVGLVEEFFFRGLLQNRLTQHFNSGIAAICVTSLIFGIVHAPGMYLRNAGVLDGIGEAPSLFTSLSYCIAVQSLPGFFFGIIWHKTKNLWLLMAIHALVDLLPGFPEFVSVWGI